jgi:hypothetical protein
VASYDAPGVGDEPRRGELDMNALRGRGLEEIERRGWERCLIAGDEHGAFPAIEIAAARPERLAGLAIGHACLSYRRHGERPPIRADVMSAFNRLAEVDYRTYARALTQLTQDAYDDETAEEYIRRVPQEVTLAYAPEVFDTMAETEVGPKLRGLHRPLLFAKHEGCLAWTDEGFDDAVAAFPDARAVTIAQKPSVSPAFAEALREFCGGLDWGE